MPWRIAAMLVLAAMTSVDAQQFPNRDRVARSLGRETRTGVVIGTVVDPDTGRGVPNAVVTISGEGRVFPLATDPLGRYYFVDLPEGEYRIRAEKPGHVPGEFGKLRPNGPGHPLYLRAGEWRIDGNVDLWRTGVISGYVGNEIGEPVVGVRVQAMRRDFVGGSLRIAELHADMTDDLGQFRISGLTPGEYLVVTPTVQVSVPLAAFERVAQSGSSAGLGHLVSLGTDMRSQRAGTGLVESMVYDADDETVRLGGLFATPPAPDHGRPLAYPTQYYPSTDTPMQALAVPVDAGEEFSGISFYLRPLPTVTISGLVVGPEGPVESQLLRLVPDTGEDFGAGFEAAATVTEPDGSFKFTSVPNGSYVIDARSGASARYLSPASDAEPASASQAESFGLWSMTPVTTMTSDIEDLVVIVREGVTLTGTVQFPEPQPVSAEQAAKVRVSLYPVAGGRAGTPDGQPDTDGSFRIPGVLPDAYHVGVTTPAGWFVESVTGDGLDLTSVPLDTGSSGAIEIAVALTDRPTQLTGTVRDFRGFVVPTATVVVFPSAGDGLPPLRARAARVDSYGIFGISGLPSGNYNVVAIEEAAAGNWQEPSKLAQLRAAATRVTLRAGQAQTLNVRIAVFR